MKNLKLFAISMILLISIAVKAQVVISPPAWGPAGYSGVRYYYLPDVETFYDVQTAKFIYYRPGTWYRPAGWTYTSTLPSQYKSYNLYKGHKIVLTKYHGATPYIYYKQIVTKYPKGYYVKPQVVVAKTGPGGNTQVKVTSLKPAWIPTGYTGVRYYYLPDIETYYDIQTARFIYYDKGKWVHNVTLPVRYKSYNLYAGHKVVLTKYYGHTPYIYYKQHKEKYSNYHWTPPKVVVQKPNVNVQVKVSPQGSHPDYKKTNPGNAPKNQDYKKVSPAGNNNPQKNYPDVKKTSPSGNNQPQKGGQDNKKITPVKKVPQKGNKEDDKNKHK